MSYHQYSKEELDFLSKLSNLTGDQISENFNNKFNLNISKQRLLHTISRHKLNVKAINPYRFKKGHQSFNTLPIYSEKINKRGDIFIKLPGLKSHWVLKHRYLYETHYNIKLDVKDRIIFLDGNKHNLSIDNLRIISPRAHGMYNKLRNGSNVPNLNKIYYLLAQIYDKCRLIEEGKER